MHAPEHINVITLLDQNWSKNEQQSIGTAAKFTECIPEGLSLRKHLNMKSRCGHYQIAAVAFQQAACRA
jgi:hypothetical protein